MNPIAQGSFDRLKTALTPTATAVKDFVLTKTKLNGRSFSLKNHEFQGKIIDTLNDPDIDLVIQKPSQVGVSEVIYRCMLAYAYLIRGYAAAIVFPTRVMSNEVFATRVNPIIEDCGPLKAIKNSSVDSNSVKMFLNNSIIYALGASASSKSTVINRPIRTIIADELARCDIGVITAMRSRQRHQEHQNSIYFSTPLFEKADIDAEMEKCGTIWEQILHCEHCGHPFFPNFYENTRLKGFDDPIKTLKQEHVDRFSLDLYQSWLECPVCHKPTTHEHGQFEWVKTYENPARPKTGIRLNAYCMPKYVDTPKMLADWVAYEDKVEFHQQVLGLPAAKSDTTMDISKIVFENAEPGPINVFGLDLGRINHLMIATVTSECIFVHTRVRIPLKDLIEELPKIVGQWNCLAGVIDFMPYSNIAVQFVNMLPNTWASLFIDPTTPMPELFRLKVKDDEAFGNVRQIQINKSLFFDTYVNELMNARFVFKDGDDKTEIIEHHEAMRRVRDHDYVELRYKWIKLQGNKNIDHWFMASIYTMAAARLMIKSSVGSLPLSAMMTSFKLKSDL